MRVSEIISRFGTASALARELGVPMTTVASWKQNNHVPAWRQAKLLELAATRGVELATTDFPPPEERVAA